MRSKEELIEIDRLMMQIRRKDIEQKCKVIKFYYICLALVYLSIGALIIFKAQ